MNAAKFLAFYFSYGLIVGLIFVDILSVDHRCDGYQLNTNHNHQQRRHAARSKLFDGNNRPSLFCISNNNRRKFLVGGIASGLASLSFKPEKAQAALFDNKKDRRQLELCIVTILRLQYWATNVVSKLQQLELGEEVDDERKKKAYLESRLGAKVAVTGKIGGGANGNVYMLGSLQIKDCLEDVQYYGRSTKSPRVVEDLIVDLVESLASIVEFDGLETTQDPSPRSSLTLSMYNDSKAIYVSRMLNERVIPLTQELVDSFGKDVKDRCNEYIVQYYPNELPPKIPEKVVPTVVNATEVA